MAVRVARTLDSCQEFAGTIIHKHDFGISDRFDDVPALSVVIGCDTPARALTKNNGMSGQAIYITTTRESSLESLTLRAITEA